jgi:hypothetical protein
MLFPIPRRPVCIKGPSHVLTRHSDRARNHEAVVPPGLLETFPIAADPLVCFDLFTFEI